MPQTRLTPGPLLTPEGRLAQAGYATSLVRQYDRAAIRAPGYRIKEWDYYLIHDQRRGLALTVDDNSYMGLLGVSWLDFETPVEHTVNKMSLFPMGKTGLPFSSETGVTRLENGSSFAEFVNEGARRRLRVRLDKFLEGETLTADLTLTDAPADSMVIATPFAEDPLAFYYNQKIVGMRAAGRVAIGGREYSFDPACSFALLDWGRGVWTRDNTWYWSAAQGAMGPDSFGFNLGYGFGDTSAATENMLFYNGVAHKLAAVDFGIPQKPEGGDDFMAPWNFTSSDGRFEAVFTPIIDRASRTDAKLILSDQHQVFGRFTGKAVLDDGTVIPFADYLGFAEKVHNKW